MTISTNRRIVAVSGAVSNPSRTTALVCAIGQRVAQRLGGEVHLVEIAELQPAIGESLLRGTTTPDLQVAIDRIETADVLIVASPVFQASYSGLFKYVFDLVNPTALHGTSTILGATGGTDRHTLMVDYELRPLFQYFHATIAHHSIYATREDFADYTLAAPALHDRIERAIDSLCAMNALLAQDDRVRNATS